MHHPTALQITDISSRVMLYLSVGRYEAAEKLLGETIEELGDHAELHNLLGFVFHRQSQFSKALESFERSWQTDAAFIEARLNYAVTLCDLGRYTQAQSIFKEAQEYRDLQMSQAHLTLKRLAQAHEKLGDDYQSCGMKLQAHSEYQKSVSLSQDHPQARLKLAQILMDAENYKRAREELEATLTDPHCGEEARCLLGIMALRQGDMQQALNHWQSYEVPRSRLLQAYRDLALLWKNAPGAHAAAPTPPSSDHSSSSPPPSSWPTTPPRSPSPTSTLEVGASAL